MASPTVKLLKVLTADEATAQQKVREVWTAFQSAVALPFEYDDLKFGEYKDATVSDYAQAQVTDDVATIVVTPAHLLGSPSEIQLTLLHETLHVAAFAGPLREMYEAVKRLRKKYWYAHEIGFCLGDYMFEVDAELALAKKYPEHASTRAAYYVEIQKYVRLQERANGWHSRLSAHDPARPYYALGDRLCAELAGYLAHDVSVATALCEGVEQASPACAEDVETLRRMLSPNCNIYTDLPRWGAARYEEVLCHIIETVQRGR